MTQYQIYEWISIRYKIFISFFLFLHAETDAVFSFISSIFCVNNIFI